MITFITGSSHTGKTLLAQKLLEKHQTPYLSIDHLKMGLIRSGYCSLTPESDNAQLTTYLWPVLKEIAKTAIENNQNLTIEGSYIPFSYKQDFAEDYLRHIRFICLIFSPHYIESRFEDILKYENCIEQRKIKGDLVKQSLIEESLQNLELCRKYDCAYILIDKTYSVDL